MIVFVFDFEIEIGFESQFDFVRLMRVPSTRLMRVPSTRLHRSRKISDLMSDLLDIVVFVFVFVVSFTLP